MKLLGTLALIGTLAVATPQAQQRQLVTADPVKVLQSDTAFQKYHIDPEVLKSVLPKDRVAVGYDGCAFKAAYVTHDKGVDGSPGVNYINGGNVYQNKWGQYRGGCPSSVSTLYDKDNPKDGHRTIKNGDVVIHRELILLSREDIQNYLSGNTKGHYACYPLNCSPFTLEIDGVNGVDTIQSKDEHGGLRTVWKK